MKHVCLKPTVKHGGGSIMVWGYLTAIGMGDLVRIDGIMNECREIEINSYLPCNPLC